MSRDCEHHIILDHNIIQLEDILVGNHSQQASILASSTDLNSIQSPHSLSRDFRADQSFISCWSLLGDRDQVWVQVQAPAGHLAISPEGHSRLEKTIKALSLSLKNQRLPLGAALRHSVGGSESVRQASTITRRFWVCCSRCWKRPACFRNKGYHLSDTDLVRESKRLECLLILSCDESLALTTDFFCHVKWNFDDILPTKAALIASLYLSIIHWSESVWQWSSSKIKAVEQISMLWIEFCAKQQVILRPVWKKGVCSDTNWTAQPVQMAACKGVKTISGMILNR